jgi:hypothetical protein
VDFCRVIFGGIAHMMGRPFFGLAFSVTQIFPPALSPQSALQIAIKIQIGRFLKSGGCILAKPDC